jgi:serine/threonine-protein kinase RsbW
MQNSYQKIVKSDPNLIPEVNEFIFDILNSVLTDKEILGNLNLAVSEALSNAMVHGNKLDPNKNVVVYIEIANDKVELGIKDSGKGFDPNSVPDPTKPENILKDSGRGIHIMRSFIDEVVYNFSDEGTELKLIISINK